MSCLEEERYPVGADGVGAVRVVGSGRGAVEYRLGRGATVVVDEAGMLGTGALDQLTRLAQSQRWRLVLVGDPR